MRVYLVAMATGFALSASIGGAGNALADAGPEESGLDEIVSSGAISVVNTHNGVTIIRSIHEPDSEDDEPEVIKADELAPEPAPPVVVIVAPVYDSRPYERRRVKRAIGQRYLGSKRIYRGRRFLGPDQPFPGQKYLIGDW